MLEKKLKDLSVTEILVMHTLLTQAQEHQLFDEVLHTLRDEMKTATNIFTAVNHARREWDL